MNEEKLKRNIRLSCEKYEIRGKDKDVVDEWLHKTIIEYGILKNIEMGNIEIVNVDGSEPLFSLTKKGIKSVKKMIK